jgi:hypothetical protein
MDKTMFRVRRAQLDDARTLAPRLREADRMEIRANSGDDPQRVLERGIEASVPSCAMLDDAGEVLALFGVVPHPTDARFGIVWMLGSDALVARQAIFLRTSKHWLARLYSVYAALGNVIDARNTVHLNWLKWLGFEAVSRIDRHGVEQRPFIAFRGVRPGYRQEATSSGMNPSH